MIEGSEDGTRMVCSLVQICCRRSARSEGERATEESALEQSPETHSLTSMLTMAVAAGSTLSQDSGRGQNGGTPAAQHTGHSNVPLRAVATHYCACLPVSSPLG